MVVEHKVLPMLTWLMPNETGLGALVTFLITVVLVALGGFFFGFLIAAVRHGPVEAFFLAFKVIFASVAELRRVSLRRLVAMARLAFQESLRRRVLVAFAVFVLILLFGGWMLNRKSDHPARLYISLVLTTTNYMVLALALLLSTSSLPNDVKNRTIYTVVTKPVLAWEIVLGRILGFAAIGTVLLAGMCFLSYFFVTRGLAHSHTIVAADMTEIEVDTPGEKPPGRNGETSLNRRLGHRHPVKVDRQGRGYTESVKDHRHAVVTTGKGGDLKYHVGPATGWLQARVPVYGKLRFLDRTGRRSRMKGAKIGERGVSVGTEWTYRSFVEGDTQAAAIWTFEGVTPRSFPDGHLPVELTIRVFRTHKGDIEEGIAGLLALRNPSNGLESTEIPFTAREFTVDQKFIPRQLKSRQGKNIDLFEDLVHNGRIDIRIRCAERGQYFGMAPADVYLRSADRWFSVNFVKGYVSIWFQMLLIICFGVMFSTILSGPVAMMATSASIIIGYCTQFIIDVSTGKIVGGGPLESLIRLLTQQNVTTPLNLDKDTTTIIQNIDVVLMVILRGLTALLPNFSRFGTSDYVASGYSIQTTLMTQQFLAMVAYLTIVTCVGYFLLRTREIAA